MNSLDPRVKRLPKLGQPGVILPKAEFDQFGTFEVFVQPREARPFQHEGIVHAPNLEMAFVLAKEAFTRRFTCSSLSVVDTRNVFVSPLTDRSQNVYDLITGQASENGPAEAYEIFHLLKRGKQHLHAATVMAVDPRDAMVRAKDQFGSKITLNIWAIRTADIRFTGSDEKELWITLAEKKFRDATEYKAGEKLQGFLDRTQS